MRARRRTDITTTNASERLGEMGVPSRWNERLSGETDGERVSAATAGPQGAGGPDDLARFSALLGESAATITHIAAALVGMADAEDATQEAVLRAWRAWPDLRQRDAARAWLTSITVNVCRDWLRGRFGSRLRLTEPLTDEPPTPRALATLDDDPGASDHAAALDLRAAINLLDEDLRVVVTLRYYAGLDSSAIGAALGVPAATARTRLRRALGLLRDQLSSGPYATNTADTIEGRRSHGSNA